MSRVHNTGEHAGWVGRVLPGIKEFFKPPFLVLKASLALTNTVFVINKWFVIIDHVMHVLMPKFTTNVKFQ